MTNQLLFIGNLGTGEIIIMAIRQLGQSGGFSQNPKWRISLPDSLQTPAKIMRGLGKGVRSFKEGVNNIEKDIENAAEEPKK